MPRAPRWTPPGTPFSAEHVAPLGVTRAMLRAAVDAGRIVRLGHGVFVCATALPTDAVGRHLMGALALQVRHPTLIASHHTAALAWGLALDDPAAAAASPPAFIDPSAAARSMRIVGARLSVRSLPTHHRTTHPSGLLVTTPARAAVDVAAEVPLTEGLMTLDSASRLHLLDLVGDSRIRSAYRNDRTLAAARRPILEAAEHAGTQFTRRHLAQVAPLVDPRRESPLESLSFGHFVLAGLPLPELQVRISTPLGDVYPDNLWAAQRVIGEADGAEKYRSPEDLVHEKRRQEALEQLGYVVVRWMTQDMRRRPSSVIARVGAALDARS